MKFHRPFDPSTGAPSTNPAVLWQNEDVGLGIEGSIPPAEVYNDTQREIVNAIEGSGLVADAADLTQLWQAIQRAHRITASVTLHVPSQYATLQAALAYLSTKMIAQGVDVTIELAAGDHAVNIGTGPVFANLRDGHRVKIKGQPIVGAFPTLVGVNNATAATVEAALRATWPTRIVVTGNVDGMIINSGVLRGLENLLFIGDNTAGRCGLIIGKSAGEMGSAAAMLRDVWFHRYGFNGLSTELRSVAAATRLGATHCGDHGMRVSAGSGLSVDTAMILARHVKSGIEVQRGAWFSSGGTTDSANNGGNGILVEDGSTADFSVSTVLNVPSNGANGLSAARRGYIMLTAGAGPTFTAGGNGGFDFRADEGSYITATAAQTSAKTNSPALNTVGNDQSYIKSA